MKEIIDMINAQPKLKESEIQCLNEIYLRISLLNFDKYIIQHMISESEAEIKFNTSNSITSLVSNPFHVRPQKYHIFQISKLGENDYKIAIRVLFQDGEILDNIDTAGRYLSTFATIDHISGVSAETTAIARALQPNNLIFAHPIGNIRFPLDDPEREEVITINRDSDFIKLSDAVYNGTLSNLF